MNFEAVIGIEMHCEMTSQTKVFSPGSNSFSKSANTHVNAIDLALPGILPTVNINCVKKAIKAASILKWEIPSKLVFDRKNYYYPDLPKGYQITQNTSPIGINGNIDIECKEQIVNVKIHDIHLEEDTASIDHLESMSLIDYNRAGVPLLECVTEPCLHTADEAVAFIDTMCKIYQYADISEADSKRGQIRCDVNVSIREKGTKELGTKVEYKGISSFGAIYDVINHETKRQINLKEAGKYDEVEQETRRWDEEKCTSFRMRSKVDAIDYKYFIEPNIPPFTIEADLIKEIQGTIPMLALERKQMYINKFGLDAKSASIIVKDKLFADYYEKCVSLGIDAKIAANYVNGMIISYINKEEITLNDFYLKPEYLKQIIDAQNEGIISSKQAKEVFMKALEDKKEPKNFISKENSQITDENLIEEIIDSILVNNQENIIAYQNGKTNMFDFFVGQVMKETKGKASPIITKDLLHKKIDK